MGFSKSSAKGKGHRNPSLPQGKEKNQIHNLTLQLKQLEKEEMRNPMEKEMATHSNVLAWRISVTAEPGGLPSMGSHRIGHN